VRTRRTRKVGVCRWRRTSGAGDWRRLRRLRWRHCGETAGQRVDGRRPPRRRPVSTPDTRCRCTRTELLRPACHQTAVAIQRLFTATMYHHRQLDFQTVHTLNVRYGYNKYTVVVWQLHVCSTGRFVHHLVKFAASVSVGWACSNSVINI